MTPHKCKCSAPFNDENHMEEHSLNYSRIALYDNVIHIFDPREPRLQLPLVHMAGLGDRVGLLVAAEALRMSERVELHFLL